MPLIFSKIRRRKIFLTAGILALFLALIVVFVFINDEKPFAEFAPSAPLSGGAENPADCIDRIEEAEVRGDSLAPLIPSGRTVKLFYGYYRCHKAERGDLVVFRYAGHAEAPLIKIVRAAEGDAFQFKKSVVGDCWNILVNAEILGNSQDVPYCLPERDYKMLALYERDYKGIIPQNACLVLGDAPEGTLDSGRFGLVDQSDFLAKAICQ